MLLEVASNKARTSQKFYSFFSFPALSHIHPRTILCCGIVELVNCGSEQLANFFAYQNQSPLSQLAACNQNNHFNR
jgi:hypothetical protein